MSKQPGIDFRNAYQPLVSTVPRLPVESTILVPDPHTKTEVQYTKHAPHLRFPEFAIVVNPPNDL
jgi:hypothetical protein